MSTLIIKVKIGSENVVWNLPQHGERFEVVVEEAERLVLSFDGPDLSAAEEQALNTNPDVVEYTSGDYIPA